MPAEQRQIADPDGDGHGEMFGIGIGLLDERGGDSDGEQDLPDHNETDDGVHDEGKNFV